MGSRCLSTLLEFYAKFTRKIRREAIFRKFP